METGAKWQDVMGRKQHQFCDFPTKIYTLLISQKGDIRYIWIGDMLLGPKASRSGKLRTDWETAPSWRRQKGAWQLNGTEAFKLDALLYRTSAEQLEKLTRDLRAGWPWPSGLQTGKSLQFCRKMSFHRKEELLYRKGQSGWQPTHTWFRNFFSLYYISNFSLTFDCFQVKA